MVSLPARPGLCLLLVGSLAAGLAAAGCSDPAPAKTPATGTPVGTDEAALRILVVDTAVRPLAGAGITFDGRIGGGPYATGPDGEVRLSGLAPGVYGFTVAKAGYFPAASTVTASAGEPQVTTATLEVDAATAPYAELVKFDGMVGCSTGLGSGQGTFNPCVLSSNIVTELCESYGQCMSDPTGANPWYTVPIASPPTFHQAETVWEPTTSTASLMGTLAYAGTGLDDMTMQKAVRSSPSPMVLTVTEDELHDWKTGVPGNILRYYWMGADEVGSVTVQQPFQSFITSTFRFTPPEGWTFVRDGSAVPPQ